MRLAEIPSDPGALSLPLFLRSPALLRRIDPASGVDVFVLRQGILRFPEQLRLDVDGDLLRVTQTLPSGIRVYQSLFMSVFYLVGLGGLIGALSGHLSAVALVGFPAFARLLVFPSTRWTERGRIEAFLASHLAVSD